MLILPAFGAPPWFTVESPLAPGLVLAFRHKFERYIARDRDNPDLRRKAMTAITAKMARVVHAVIKGGSDYRPFVEGRVPGGRASVR